MREASAKVFGIEDRPVAVVVFERGLAMVSSDRQGLNLRGAVVHVKTDWELFHGNEA
jgi:hypothetical protein